MVVNRRVFRDTLNGALQIISRLVQTILLVINPTQAVEIGAILGIELHSAANHLLRFLQPFMPVSQHIAQIIQCAGVIRLESQNFPELGFSGFEVLHLL